MSDLRKIVWSDVNSEPPKNYLWNKTDGIYKWNGTSWQKCDQYSSLDDLDNFYVVDTINVVALENKGIPNTGTITQEEITKLSADNCLLKYGNTYYHKSYESENGMDYLPLGLTSYLNGIRSTYFTVDKTEGQYTIAYTHPIEANTNVQNGQDLGVIRNLKVGNTTYYIPEVATISGTVNNGNFVADINSIAFATVIEIFRNGGVVQFDTGTEIKRANALINNNDTWELHAQVGESSTWIVWTGSVGQSEVIDNGSTINF